VGLLAAIAALDIAVMHAARGAPVAAVPVFVVLSLIGGGYGLLALVPFLVRRTTRPAALWLLAAVVATSGAVSLVKAIVGRVRPCDALAWCEPIAFGSPGGPSFPSGHAAGSFAFAAYVVAIVAGWRSRPWWAPPAAALAVLYAALVAWSRCVLGVHYPSDVIAGAVLGSAFGAAFALAASSRLAAAAGRGGLPAGAGGSSRSPEGLPRA
jgi:undecaprenyl-diphosphatase